MTTPALHLHGVTIRRRGVALLSDFGWEHQAGKIAWVVGENGAGKSTLLRVLARRMRPDKGTVDHSVAADSVIQYLHPGMAGPPACSFSTWLHLQRSLCPDAAALLEWTDPLLPTLPATVSLDTLSTGERKRVLLHALLRRPAGYTILDEPYEHLSDKARRRLSEILQGRATTAVVVVATNQAVALQAEGVTLRIDIP